MDDEGNNWQERCERYFTSLTDSDKQLQRDKKMKYKQTSKENLDSVAKVGLTKSDLTSKKSATQYWFRALDIHGIHFAGSVKNNLERAVWVLITIIGFGAFSFLLFLTISSYITQDHHLNLRSPSVFSNYHPETHVTICNLNMFKKSSLSSIQNRFSKLPSINSGVFNPQPQQSTEQLITNTDLWNILTKSYETGIRTYASELDQEFIPFSGMAASDDWESLYGASMKYGFEIWTEAIRPTISEMRMLGHKAGDLIVQCNVDEGGTCQLSSAEDITSSQGNCATFNVSENTDKISLILNSEPAESVPVLAPATGLSVQVYSSQSSLLHSRKHLVAPGHHLVIQNKKMISYSLSFECSKVKENSYQKCEEDCLESLTFKYCQCHTDRQQEHQCRVNDKFQYVCPKVVKKLISRGSLNCGCQHKCSEIRYETDSSTIPWPSSQHLEHLESSLQHLHFNKTTITSSLSYVTIDIRPEVLEELTEGQTISLLDLLSRIGGLSALVIGMSIITVFQFIWLLIKLCFYGITSKRSDPVGEVEKLGANSEITSVSWQAFKNKSPNEARQRYSVQPDLAGCLNRNNSRRSYLEPIEEERKHGRGNDRNDHVIIEDQLYSHPWERTGHRRPYSTTFNSNQTNGGEFPLFNYIDSRSSSPMPRCSTPDNSDYRSTARLVPANGDVRLYPSRNKMSPADAIKTFGSPSKYQYNGPFYL